MRVTSDLLLLWQTLIHEINFKKQLAMYKICGLLSMNEDINFWKKLLTQKFIHAWSQVVRMWVGGDLDMKIDIIGDQRMICSWFHRTQRIRLYISQIDTPQVNKDLNLCWQIDRTTYFEGFFVIFLTWLPVVSYPRSFPTAEFCLYL